MDTRTREDKMNNLLDKFLDFVVTWQFVTGWFAGIFFVLTLLSFVEMP